jgi:hypothetical protein
VQAGRVDPVAVSDGVVPFEDRRSLRRADLKPVFVREKGAGSDARRRVAGNRDADRPV